MTRHTLSGLWRRTPSPCVDHKSIIAYLLMWKISQVHLKVSGRSLTNFWFQQCFMSEWCLITLKVSVVIVWCSRKEHEEVMWLMMDNVILNCYQTWIIIVSDSGHDWSLYQYLLLPPFIFLFTGWTGSSRDVAGLLLRRWGGTGEKPPDKIPPVKS